MLLKETILIEEVVHECLTIAGERAQSKGIDLENNLTSDLPPLNADRLATKQILLNLLSNAVKFTPEGGKVTILTTASKNEVHFQIVDTGIGISSEKLPELANPFVRVEQDPHRAVDGWGLGLAITKSLIDLHDGKFVIESKIGKGTEVSVTLPNEIH